jgi:uncharacterized protein
LKKNSWLVKYNYQDQIKKYYFWRKKNRDRKYIMESLKNSLDDINKIDAPESDYLYISPSQIPAAGTGLYTSIKIYKDEVISVFKGEIITDDEARARAEKGNDKYFMNMLDGSIMDTMRVKCFAKYANDAKGISTSNFKNNSKIGLDEYDNVALIAIRKIKAGEEIFCGYGKKYWKRHS